MLNRRDLLAAGAASASIPLAATTDAKAQPAQSEGQRLTALLEAIFAETLRRNPETATNLGLDTGANADLRRQLRDESATGRAAGKALDAEQLRRLTAIDRSQLTDAQKINYDTVLYTRLSAASLAAYDYGQGSNPYVITQQNGAYQSVPDFLDTKHPIANAADADAYLARMEAFAALLDQNTAQQAHDAAGGVIAPDFVLDKAIVQLGQLRQPAANSGVVASLIRRAALAHLPASYADNAGRLWTQSVLPAISRQLEQTRRMRARATHDAGVKRLPGGEAFYAAALRAQTTTTLSPAEVHALGRDQAAEITARIDSLLRARGLTQGTVGARIRGLYADPAVLFANTDEGKVALIAYCNERQAAIVPRLSRFFKVLPPYRFEVRRVPPSIEAGASSAYSQGASLDGSRPGIVYFNLADSHEWPRWALPTTIYHEGLPGHQLEGGLALANHDLPMIRKVSGFAAYSEGWGLYAEQLADELGMYEDDPLGRIGYLRFQLFRALRCVADTGLHDLGWSREQAIALFVDEDGDAPGFATREVERYCVNPGQACAYKIGHTVWNRARERASQALGPRYDIKDFHEAGLAIGRTPLDVLDGAIDRFITARARA